MTGVALIGNEQMGGVRAYTRRLEAALREARPEATIVRMDGRGPRAWSSPLWVAAAALRLAGLAALGRIDTVHLMTTERLCIARMAALAAWSRALGLRVVLHHHGADFAVWSARTGPAGLAALRLATRSAHANLVLGRAWETRLRLLARVPEGAVRRLPNALPDRPMPERRPRNGPMRVLFLGVMVPRKGPGRLVEALGRLAASGMEVEAVFAGDGPERDAVAARAQALGLHARFPGAVDEAGAVALMAWADVLAHPSTREGLPLTVLEAMRAGLPCLALPAGAIEETLGEDDGVRLVRSLEPAAWAEALHRLAVGRSEAAALGLAGRRAFERRFRIEAHAREVMEVYGWRRPSPIRPRAAEAAA
ncbi:MAG: glycosyltransferase family 4 protein [Pseudomonadota bacterium]